MKMKRILASTTIQPNAKKSTMTQNQNKIQSNSISSTNNTNEIHASTNFSTNDSIKRTPSGRLSTKEILPPIMPNKSQLYDENDQDVQVTTDKSFPLKLFDGKKQSLDELNAESMTYIWLRRFKEIFLHMNDGEDDHDEVDSFVEFDLNLAKIDLANTCDRYIENERFILAKQNNAENKGTCQKSDKYVDIEKVKIDLIRKQEWDMKKLYAEVFKMSYKHNPLRTETDQDQLKPTQTGDDQPNFINAIWWYSCDKASIYYQINSIVRLENFELLMSYRYYLSDLCRSIEFMYRQKLKEEGDIERKFYRADNINENQLKVMCKRQKAQFISLLGFISTTSDIDIAKGYAQKQRVYEGNVRVLFIITVKPHVPCTAFAYIDRISFHPEEKEVLFSMGSSFVVEEILEPANGENYYRLHLTACEIDKSLVEDIRIKVGNCSPSGRAVLLARYLVELGEYRAARKYLTSLLTQAGLKGVLTNDISLVNVYNCLGMTYDRQGLHNDALKAFKQALNTQARLEYSNNNALAEIHNNIGLSYVGLGHMDEAEAMFTKAVRMQLREPKSNQQYLASIYSNIGYVHYKQKNYDEAEKIFKKAEKLYQQNTNRIVHDALELSLMKAEFLTNYGRLLSVHKRSTDNRKPEYFYNEALKLYKSILSDGDPKLMQTYINIMLTFAQNKSYNEVTKCFNDPTVQKLIDKQDMNMFELNSSITQSTLGSLYELIGACYASQDQYFQAIRIWKDAYIFERKAKLEKLLLVTTDNNSSILSSEHNRFIHECYRKTIHFYIKLSNENHQAEESQFSSNFCLGLLYVKLHNHHSAIECLKKVTTTQLKSDEEILSLAHLLLSDISQRRQHNQDAINHFDKSIQFIKSQEDPVFEIQIKLSRIDCYDNDELKINELQKLKQSLGLYGSDTKYICLKVIILDKLAWLCLIKEQYKSFQYATEQSISLKRISLSQYHPSLAINFIYRAKSYVQQAEQLSGESSDITNIRRSHYREALLSYERALEVYSLNLSQDHIEVKRIYYSIGNILCDMDELSKALEKYNLAENTYSDSDQIIAQTNDGDNTSESNDTWMDQGSMHQHLAEYYARKKLYKEAISEINETIHLYSGQISSSTFNNTKYDMSFILESLRHLAQSYTYLGDTLGMLQNDDDGYFVALDIYMKLVPYDKSLEKKEALLYGKISNYYEDLGDHDDALQSFQKVIDLEEPTIISLYKLAHLYHLCHQPNESIKIYKKLLSHSSIAESKEFQHIIQKKMDETFKSADNQYLESKTSNLNTNSINSSKDLQQNLDSQKIHDISIINSIILFDDRSMADAYLKFEDYDMALKFYEKDVETRIRTISNGNIFKNDLEKIDQTSYTHNQQNILPILPELFLSLVEEIRKIIILTDSPIATLVDSLIQSGSIHLRFLSYLKAIKNYTIAFGLYASESFNTNNPSRKTFLLDMMSNILKDFISCQLKSKKIIHIYHELSLPEQANHMSLKLFTMNHDNELDDIDDEHSINGNNYDSRLAAIQHYKSLLTNTDDIDLKSVCYYNILRSYKHHLHPDQDSKDIIHHLIQHLPKFHVLDRRLLIVLAMDFLNEYDKHNIDHNYDQQWHLLAIGSLNHQLKDEDESFIGAFLLKIGNLTAAETFWRSIIKLIENTLSSRILELLYDSDTTLKEIIQAAEHLECDNKILCDRLATAYEKLADYFVDNATNNNNTDGELLRKAKITYKKATDLLEQLNTDMNRINDLKIKQKKLEEGT
ncbi:unnamed protein product [Adineta ricciae]|uniref:Uncharacterized protein n=1 Tax=Adineta ricciae TaxID=249248 RepID=A0A815TGS9_ADIRI|nr:unnamed protein product [Adineta ricciae]